MHRHAHAHHNDGNFTRNMFTEKARALRDAASDWTGSVSDNVRSNLVKAGYKTETYVRSHPGRFIAGACCMGLAAGWALGRSMRRK